jgi:protoheme IX farnesyltransferase
MRDYIQLAKPGIIMGNLVTAISGFLLASRGSINYGLFFAMLFGLACIIASACTFNNCFDAEADLKMKRTQNRPLAKKTISQRNACIFGVVLLLIGVLVLLSYTNFFALAMALLGFALYVGVYSLVKYHTSYATAIGSIAGALPPIVGYVAVNPRFDTAMLLLFAIIALWQMPHFYAIAIYRLEDYRAANIPVLPLVKGIYVTKIHMLVSIVFFLLGALALTLFGYTGYVYGVSTALLGAFWLWLSLRGFSTSDSVPWAKSMFFLSLVIVMVFSLMVAVDVTSS